MTFQERFDEDIDIEYLLMTGTLVHSDGDDKCCIIDEKYVKNKY